MTTGVRGFEYARRTIEVPGAPGTSSVHELAYIDEGSGPPVVMVHGNPTWGYAFRHLVAGLVDRHRVVVGDHVGMGRSSRPAPGTYGYTLDRRIADLTSLIDHAVPDGRVDLVVHDWGGAIGLGWATRHPDRVRRVLAGNTAAFPLPPGRPLPWSLRLARSELGGLLVRRLGVFNLAAVAVGTRGRTPLDVARGYLAPYRSPADRDAVLAFVRDIPLGPGDRAWAPLAATAERLSVLADRPFTICWGLRDPVFTPDLLDEWRRRMPQARIVRLPRAGHLVFDDAADEIVAIARELFAPTRPPARPASELGHPTAPPGAGA